MKFTQERILIVSLTDDPVDPPGSGRYGGSHQFIFDLARHLVRRESDVTFITRRSRPDKPLFQEFGPLCRIHRLEVGPLHETSHHSLWREALELRQGVCTVVEKLEKPTSVLSFNWISGLAAKEPKTPRSHKHLSPVAPAPQPWGKGMKRQREGKREG